MPREIKDAINAAIKLEILNCFSTMGGPVGSPENFAESFIDD